MSEGKWRVFIVEDEALIAMELQDHLERLGYEVCGHAARGEAALRAIPELSPDLVLMDVNLGSGLSGIDVAERLIEQIEVPIIYLSAYSDHALLERAERTESSAYLTKPFEPRVLQANVQLALVRHQAARRLRESESRYRTLFESVPIGLVIADQDGRPRVRNAAALALADDGEEELDGTARAFQLRVDASTADDLRALALSGRTVERLELQAYRSDRSTFDARISLRPIELDGEPMTFAMVEDITDRRRTKTALELLSTGVAHLTGDRLYAELTRNLVELLGVDAAFIGKLLPTDPPRLRTVGLLVDGVQKDEREWDLAGTPCGIVIESSAAHTFASGVRARFPEAACMHDLEVEGYSAVPLVDAKGRTLGSVCVTSRQPLRDVEHVRAILTLFAVRAAAEIARQGEEAKFQDLFELSPDAVLITDEHGVILLASQRVEALFGYARDEVVGQLVETLIPQAIRRRHAALRAEYTSVDPRPGIPGRGPLRALHKDGTTFPVDISLSPMRFDGESLVVAAVRDVSERVQAEEQRRALEAKLRHAQKLEAMGRLGRGIAHDFNNLLAVVVANLEVARQDVGPDHAAVESLDAIGRATAQASELVRRILTFSRETSGKRGIASLRAVATEVATLVRSSIPAGVRLETAIAMDAPDVVADPPMLHQVVMNLVTNAWQAVDEAGGQVTLRVDGVELDAGAMPELPPGRYCLLEVSDDGTGIEGSLLEQIFEPFFTTKEVGRGSGLGLSVVHGIVQELGGTIDVDSTPGRGTTFRVHLPAADRKADSDVPGGDQVAATGRGRVLFLDDDLELVLATTRLLDRLGYQPAGYVRAAEAIDAVRRRPADFDLVVTDFRMPELSGLEVGRAIVETRSDLPVVLMSVDIECSEAQLAAAGIDFRLEKPFDMEALRDVLARALSERRPPGADRAGVE